MSFIKPLFAIIPRSIFPGKPLPITQQLAQYLYPNEKGLSVGASIIGEAYLNFGYPAIMIVMFLFGKFSRCIYKYLQDASKNDSMLIYACIFPLFLELFRGPFSDAVILLVIMIILFLPIFKVTRKVYLTQAS